MLEQDNHKKSKSINSICSLLNFSGENVVNFLNNLLISQLTELKENAYHYTALCNPKGRIISTLWINITSNKEDLKNQQNINIICPKNMAEELTNFFNMRKFRLKITIESKNAQLLMNPKNLTVSDSTIIDENISEIAVDTFYDAFFSHNLPWIDNNNKEQFIPQHVNLDLHEHIMSFTKGCYPGQEIIARLKYLGKIKKRMSLYQNNSEAEFQMHLESKTTISPVIHNSSKNLYSVQIIDKA